MSRPLRVGVQLPEVERPVGWPELRDIALEAEAVGFDSIWVGDHLLYRDEHGTRGPWEAWSVLAALGEATERVTLGPLVAATAFHNPAMLAKKAATVDEIAGGRLVLGIGAGWNRTEFDGFGFPFDRRASRFEESLHIVHTLLREGAIDHDGEFFTLREMELVPPARPDLPLMIGSQGPRVLAVSLPMVELWNGWHAWFGNTTDGLATLVDQIDAVAETVGVEPSSVGKTAAVLVAAPGGEGRKAGGRYEPGAPIAGDPDDVAAALARFAAYVEHVQVVLDPIDARSVTWMGEVLDRLDGT